MPDISMCRSSTCPKRTECYRHQESGTEPHPYWQSFGSYTWTQENGKFECHGFRPVNKVAGLPQLKKE